MTKHNPPRNGWTTPCTCVHTALDWFIVHIHCPARGVLGQLYRVRQPAVEMGQPRSMQKTFDAGDEGTERGRLTIVTLPKL